MTSARTQRLAWLTLITSSLVFCILFFASGYAVYYFLFQSPVPLSAKLVVSRGSAKLQMIDGTAPLIDTTYSLDSQTLIEIRDDSQAILTFQDTYSRETIASLTLTTGTRLYITEATRPRFDFSRRPYRIMLDRMSGQALITTSPGNRDLFFDLRSQLGLARLLDDGRYTVNTEFYPDTGLQRKNLFNQGGRAQLFKPSMAEWQEVNPNRIAHIANGEFELESDSPYQILAEGRFRLESHTGGADVLPNGWECSTGSEANEQPLGEFFRDSIEGNALRFRRERQSGQGRLVKHAETSCLLKTGVTGLSTAPYSGIRIQLNFKIRSQSLGLCGVVGSECPVMIEIAYRLPNDPTLRKWRHGFFITPDSTKPPSCDSCRLAHERVNSGVLYFYDSGELLPQFLELSPTAPNQEANAPIILWLSVYASGHEWDSQINDVTLLGTLTRN
jgi:hypothetical protein